ncbi:adipocyte plasma membrane-associated protein-like isoform X2 [Dysidea avara]
MILVVLIMVGVSGVVVYFLPSLIGPVGHGPDGGPRFTGVYAINNELQKARKLFEGQIAGPESFELGKDGHLYTGLIDGRVVKIDLEKETYTIVTRMGDPPYDKCGQIDMLSVCGRPLGLHWDNSDNLIVADAYKGLVSINTKTGKKNVLCGPKISTDVTCTFFNYPVVISNGSVFFSCLSVNFAEHDLLGESFPFMDYIFGKHNDTGMLLHYNPITGQTSVVKQLNTPNGVAKSSDEEFLLVSELSKSRVARFYLKGPKEGQWDMFISGLPGIVDNITPSRKYGGFWFAVPFVRPSALLDFSSQQSWIQFIAAKLQLANVFNHPEFLHNMILLVDEEGRVVRSLHDPTAKVVFRVSEVLEVNDELMIGSIFGPSMARMKLN